MDMFICEHFKVQRYKKTSLKHPKSATMHKHFHLFQCKSFNILSRANTVKLGYYEKQDIIKVLALTVNGNTREDTKNPINVQVNKLITIINCSN